MPRDHGYPAGRAAPAAAPQFSERPSSVVIPELVQQRAASLGDPGVAWLHGLPQLIVTLESLWDVTIGDPLEGGTAAFVAPARTCDGQDAIVKVAVPNPHFREQIGVLERAQGQGYVRILAAAPELAAILQEPLGPSLEQISLPVDDEIHTLCRLLKQAWQVPPATEPTQTAVEEKALQLHALVDQLWADLGRPCSAEVRSQALRYAERRAAAARPDNAVVVHGDPHAGNVLRVRGARAGAELGFVFVDPDGFLNEPPYDLGVVLRDWCRHLLAGNPAAIAQRICSRLTADTGVGPRAVWEWGYLERVSTGLHCIAIGAVELGEPFLRTAEALGSVQDG